MFDIDEMFEFLKYWKTKFSFHAFLVFYAIFSSIFRTKNSVVENKKWGGAKFLFIKTSLSILFSVLCHFHIEKCHFNCWLNVRWFLQIVDREFLLMEVRWKVVSPDSR